MPRNIHLVRWLTIAAFVAVLVLIAIGSGDQPLNVNAQEDPPPGFRGWTGSYCESVNLCHTHLRSR